MQPLTCFLLGVLCVGFLGAQDPVYLGFLRKNTGDPLWTSTESAFRTSERTRWLSALSYPEITLKSQASYSPSSLPVSGEVYLRIPVLDVARAVRLAGLSQEARLAGARWEEYRRDSFESFVLALMRILELRQLQQSKSRTTETYRELSALAQKRQSLGAGSARESVLAEMVWKRSRVAQVMAELDFSEALNGLGTEASRWFRSLPEDTDWFQAQVWPDLLGKWGWSDLPAESAEGYIESPVLALEQENVTWRLGLLSLQEAPQLDFYSQVRWENPSFQTSLEAGLLLTWKVFSETSWGGARISTREDLENRRMELELRRKVAGETYQTARAFYLKKMEALRESGEITRTAEKFTGILQTAFSAGTGTLEDILEGWQMLSSAQEEELSIRWSALKSAVSLLRVSGKMVLPSGDSP